HQKRIPAAEDGIGDGLGAVNSNGKKSSLLWIPDGVKINKIVYLDFLKTKVFLWIHGEFGGTELRPILQRLCKSGMQSIFTTFGARSFDLPHLLIETPLTLPRRGWANKDQMLVAAEAAWNKIPENIVLNS
ncbi:Uncharacterized protein FKW44_010429, partial [Caligus rogercresseyi]